MEENFKNLYYIRVHLRRSAVRFINLSRRGSWLEIGKIVGSISARLFVSNYSYCLGIKNFQDLVAGGGGGESAANLAVGQHFRNRSEGTEM